MNKVFAQINQNRLIALILQSDNDEYTFKSE